MSKLNVLVYSGSGVSPSSLTQTLTSLRSLLANSYDVQLITPKSLLSSPWSDSCALLVFPGGRDLPYQHDLSGPANARIKQYVAEEGGCYLGLCAGAYYACESVEFELGRAGMEVVGQRELRFFEGVGRGAAFPGFQYETEEGAREVAVVLSKAAWGEEIWTELQGSTNGEDGKLNEAIVKVWYNGGGTFVPRLSIEPDESVTVLARYDDLPDRPIAGVKCRVGKGLAVLWAVHPEHALLPLSPSSSPSMMMSTMRIKEEERRMILMRSTLKMMNLNVAATPAPPPQLLPLFLVSSDPSTVGSIYTSIQLRSNNEQQLFIDRSDSFVLKIMDESTQQVIVDARSAEGMYDADALRLATKTIISCLHGAIPSRDMTPLFDFDDYLVELSSRRTIESLSISGRAGFGETILYGETVTSTQTLLDKNDALVSLLPSGLVFLASQQVAGRGRGSNTWLSPSGCLQFSLLLRLPVSRSSSIVFVQYLFGLAVVEALRSEKGYEEVGKRVRLKWPNDIYVDMAASNVGGGSRASNDDRWKKIGGILVNSSFMDNEFSLIIGCGINNTNSKPTTCISDLVSLQNTLSPSSPPLAPLSSGKLLAAILKQFEKMWSVFLLDGFDPFLDSYLERWIHSNQIITIASNALTSPAAPFATPQRVKIVSITPDHGLLRTVLVDVDRNGKEVFGGGGSAKRQFIDLQPDGNSFDMLAGLIKTKTLQ